jgi:BirA family biotin operon repressor/biotin-[acetyl-CoA-carboxylase] ligase
MSMMACHALLLQRLGDGCDHDADSLLRLLGLSTQQLSTAIDELSNYGLRVVKTSRGYRLDAPLDLIDRAVLEHLLSDALGARVERVNTAWVIDSTNTQLLSEGVPSAGCLRVSVAEFQTAGRGRRGRAWLQPLGSGICLSVDWLFLGGARAVGALGLAAGVAIVRALQRFSVPDLALKWPNDLLKAKAKLGGILCELRVLPDGAAHVVIGVGLNVALPDRTRDAIVASGGLMPADLSDATRTAPSRTRLVAALVEELARMLVAFEARGLAPFLVEWGQLDALRHQPVRVQGPTGAYDGVAHGIAVDGGLQVESAGRMFSLQAGEVSVRAC